MGGYRMQNADVTAVAAAGLDVVPDSWMAASQLRPLVLGDPALIWLEYHGRQHGFEPDQSPYDFLTFIGEKGRQFEDKWVAELAPEAVRVCKQPYDVRSAGSLRETTRLMQRGVPVIAQPALWWAPERVYGVPDLIVLTSWLSDKFPELLAEDSAVLTAPRLAPGIKGHYVTLDLKFTTGLQETKKQRDLQSYAAQVRMCSYMLGHLQGLMPDCAYLVTRDRLQDPLRVSVSSVLGQALDGDLTALRDRFIDIKVNGENYLPWQDAVVAPNYSNDDERWGTAKQIIAEEKTPGGDPCLMYRVTPPVREQLRTLGYQNLRSLLEAEPATVPFVECKGIGDRYAAQIRCVLQANASQACVLPPAHVIPPDRQFEYFVDFEYFTNVNVDFETQWPTLEGREMIFMVGVGRSTPDGWRFDALSAAAEDSEGELALLTQFVDLLRTETDGSFADASATAIYHWTSAEVWQSKRAADRHEFGPAHALRGLPWRDLQKAFLDGPCAVPGAWDYSLKPVAKALGRIYSEYDPRWPGDLDSGLRAMVMGWKAYATRDPLQSAEMATLTEYLEADCKALYHLMTWLRSHAD
jgi:hypothetical protein